MKYLSEVREGQRVVDIYLCVERQVLKAKNGKDYISVKLQDKTMICDAKVWDINNNIEDFSVGEFVKIDATAAVFRDNIQLNIKRLRKANKGEYEQSDYIPVSKFDIEEMYEEFKTFIDEMDDQWIKRLASEFFIFDKKIVAAFKQHSAAKSVHHTFAGGILEHTLGMLRLAKNIADNYPIINRSFLYIGAMLHDIGKLKELSDFPVVEYTDEGQLIGHIVIGVEWVSEKVREIDGFPKELEDQIKHLIISHHGYLEFGSPKKPEMLEAVVLHYIDNIDAKIKMFEMILDNSNEEDVWFGYQKFFESNMRRTIW